jgi:hypothetical protein
MPHRSGKPMDEDTRSIERRYIVKLPGENIVVELSAWRRIEGVWVEINTFNDDGVKLRLSYKNTDVKQANRLRVVYLPKGDLSRLEPLWTQIDKTNQQAQGKLSHFSKYALAID